MDIVSFGDIHMDIKAIGAVEPLRRADLVVVTGDLTNYGGRGDALQVIDALRQYSGQLLVLPGNLDQLEVLDFLEGEKISLHGRGRIINTVGIFGVGGSNITPFNTPIEFTEQELDGLLEAGYAQVAGAHYTILVSHAPPFGTTTDVLANGAHAGSPAVRAFIEKRQPDLCITGHIHEAKGRDRIGRTEIINPGMIGHGGWVEISCTPENLTAHLQG